MLNTVEYDGNLHAVKFKCATYCMQMCWMKFDITVIIHYQDNLSLMGQNTPCLQSFGISDPRNQFYTKPIMYI